MIRALLLLGWNGLDQGLLEGHLVVLKLIVEEVVAGHKVTQAQHHVAVYRGDPREVLARLVGDFRLKCGLRLLIMMPCAIGLGALLFMAAAAEKLRKSVGKHLGLMMMMMGLIHTYRAHIDPEIDVPKIASDHAHTITRLCDYYYAFPFRALIMNGGQHGAFVWGAQMPVFVVNVIHSVAIANAPRMRGGY